MTQQYDNNMRGMISKNDRKTKQNHPDIKGSCEIDGVEYWISGWQKQRRDGSGTFYSLSFQPKEDSNGGRRSGNGNTQIPDSDDIPF